MDPRIPVSCSMPSLQQQQVQMQYMNPYGVASLPMVTQHQPMPAYLTDPTSMHRLNPALYSNGAGQYQLPQLSHLPPSSCEYSMGQMISGPTTYSYSTVAMSGTPTTNCSQSIVLASQNNMNQAMPNQVQSNAGNMQNSNQVLVPQNANSNVDNSMQMSTGNSNLQTDALPNNNQCQSEGIGSLDKVTEPSAIGIKMELDNAAGHDAAADYDGDTDIEDNAGENDGESKVNNKDTNGSWPYMCILCNETFTLKKQLQKHKMMPCKKVLYIKNRCDFCRRNFTRSDHVSRHIKTVHANKFKMWQQLQMKRREMRARQTKKGRIREEMRTRMCQYCLKVFRSIEEKDIHVGHHIGEVMPYLCTVCQCKFSEESQLKLHRRTRCGKNAFKCTMCDFAAISSRVMQRHEMLHTGEKPYKCETCNKGFMSKTALKCHKYTHTGEKPFSCSDCNKSFTTQEHLKRHRMIHTGERPFKCYHCDATFNQKTTLRAHEITHETSKPYICQHCGMTFTTLTNLRSHLRTHGDEKSYSCKYCERQFGRTDTLAKHERTHTGEKPFVCRFCGHAYSRADKLHKHEKGHEGGGPTTSTPKKKAKPDVEVPAAAPPPTEEPGAYPATSDIMAYAYRLACDYSNHEDNTDLTPTVAPLPADMPPMYQPDDDPETKEKRQQFVKEYCKAMDETFNPVPQSTSCNEANASYNTNHPSKDRTTALPDPIAEISIKKEIQEELDQNARGVGPIRAAQVQHIPGGVNPSAMANTSLNSSSTLHSSLNTSMHTSIHSSIHTSINSNMSGNMNPGVKAEMDAYDGSTDEGEGVMNADGVKIRKKYKGVHLCDICQKKYSSKHALQRHQRALHKIGDKPYRCCDCQEDFDSQMHFEEHQKLHSFVCMLCPRAFITELSLKKHQEKHRNQKVHVCTTCNKAFVRKDHLQIHEKRHLSGKTTIRHVECQFCCMAFLSKEDAQEHERSSHDPHEDKPFLCLICREQFTSMALLITHKYLHRGQKPFNCSQCSRSFRFHSALLTHSKSHTGERPFKCDQCDDRFITLAHVKRHMLTHSGEKPYVCGVCSTAFSQPTSLKTHQQRAHPELEGIIAGPAAAAATVSQSFACTTCGATFKSMSNMQAHERKHLGLKDHECTYCQKKFARADTLKNHERIHRGEKPFMCSICSVSFTRKDKMKAHERRHEGQPNGVLSVVRKKKLDASSAATAEATGMESTVTSLPTQILSASSASISTPAPLVTATLLPAVSSSSSPNSQQQLATVVTATPLLPTSTTYIAMPPPPSSPHISTAYQHMTTNALPQPHHLSHHQHHLYPTTSGAMPVPTSSKHMPPPPQPQYSTATSSYPHPPHPHYSHSPSPHHIYHPSPAPSPHYSPSASPSPYAPGQLAAAAGYFTAEHANQAAAVSYHATPLFTANPAAPPQAYQLTHPSVMHL